MRHLPLEHLKGIPRAARQHRGHALEAEPEGLLRGLQPLGDPDLLRRLREGQNQELRHGDLVRCAKMTRADVSEIGNQMITLYCRISKKFLKVQDILGFC